MKVAIIDDETIILDKIKTIILENTLISGFDIDLYSNPLTFLNHKQNYDLVLLDLKMPEIHGFNVAKQLKNQNTLIIYITNYGGYAGYAFGVHAFGYLLKPVKEKEIKRQLKEALEYMQKENQKPVVDLLTKEGRIRIPAEVEFSSRITAA